MRSALIQFPDGDGLGLTGLQAKLAQDAFILILSHHRRCIPVLLKNADGADPNASPALRYAHARAHVYIHTNELAGRTHGVFFPFRAPGPDTPETNSKSEARNDKD